MNRLDQVTTVLQTPTSRFWAALLVLTFMTSAAFAAKDIPPGAPAGSCCRVDGREGSSIQRSNGVWSCQVNSIAFAKAWDAKLFPTGFNPATLLEPAAVQRIYPTCPSGWTLTVKAGQDACTAPVAVPACPAGKQLTQDVDGSKDVCKDRTLGQPAASPRPVS